MPPVPVLDSVLFVAPRVNRFYQNQAAALEQLLRTREADTDIFPVVRKEELMLTPKGFTQDGRRRYTSLGFSHVARRCARGLTALVPDLAGMHALGEDADKRYSACTAISIFNAAISLRFDCLAEKSLVCDKRAHLLEGIIGASHRYYDNLTTYQHANDVISSAALEVDFFAGWLAGRQLYLWYRSRQPVHTFRLPTGEHKLWLGYYFTNAEYSGVAVRGTVAVLSNFGCAIGRWGQRNKIAHRGLNFNERVREMFQRVTSQEFATGKLVDGVTKLCKQSLELRGEAERDMPKLKALRRFLVQHGLPEVLAKAVADDTWRNGSDLVARPFLESGHPATVACAGRTAYDVFCSLQRCSRQTRPNWREQAQRVAYDLLTGRYQL